jgi:hypothetical protein
MDLLPLGAADLVVTGRAAFTRAEWPTAYDVLRRADATVAAAGAPDASEPIEVELKGFAAPMRVQTVRWAERTG